jgi:hypothetical protein
MGEKFEFSGSYIPRVRLERSTGVGDHRGLRPSARLTARGDDCNDEGLGRIASGDE